MTIALRTLTYHLVELFRFKQKKNWLATEIAYTEYIGEITENRLYTGSDISINVFSNSSF